MAIRVGIIGAGMAGLLTARALSVLVDEVVLIEGDTLVEEANLPAVRQLRRSAPQASHAHVLLARGAELLEEWFPGLFDNLEELGACSTDMSAANNWYHFGTWKRRLDCGVRVHFQSRLLLEAEIRRRVLSLDNVRLCQHRVRAVHFAEEAPRVEWGSSKGEDFDLLIDASGRSSKALSWMQEQGWDPVPIESAQVQVTYCSARFRPGAERDWTAILVYPNPPFEKRAAGILPAEGEEVIVSLFGWCGEKAEASDEGMLAFARSLPQPEVADFLSNAERKSEISVFHFNSARRLRVDRIGRFPSAFCLVGDALCSLDPVFGQGMTLAALQAQYLAECLQGSQGDVRRATERYRRGVQRITQTAWELSTTEDFRFPEVQGKRPWGLGLAHSYTRKVHELSAHDDNIYRRFARVMNLLDPPSSLFHLSVVGAVLRASFRARVAVQQRPTGPERE